MGPSKLGVILAICPSVFVEWYRIEGVSQLVFLAERQAELRPHLWTWRNDFGVQTSSQEKEAPGKEGEGDEEMWILSGKQVPARLRVMGLFLMAMVCGRASGGRSPQHAPFLLCECTESLSPGTSEMAGRGSCGDPSQAAMFHCRFSSSVINCIRLLTSSNSHFKFYNFLGDPPIGQASMRWLLLKLQARGWFWGTHVAVWGPPPTLEVVPVLCHKQNFIIPGQAEVKSVYSQKKLNSYGCYGWISGCVKIVSWLYYSLLVGAQISMQGLRRIWDSHVVLCITMMVK